MAATTYAELGQIVGASWAAAFGTNSNAQNLDILQIVDEGGSVVLNIDYTGTVHNPASSPTNGTNYGPYLTRLASGQSTSSYFADAFSNPAQQDILQLISPTGGSVVHYIDYTGTAH